VLWCPAQYVLHHHGEEAVERLARVCGIQMRDFWEKTLWLPYERLAPFFQEVRDIVGDDFTFHRALLYRINDAFGPSRYVLVATTPSMLLQIAARTTKLNSTGTEMIVLDHSRNHVRIRYTSSFRAPDETRLMCLSRRVVTGALPTIFGLPAAECIEHSCIADGDEACEYEFRYYTRGTWLPAVVGFAMGLMVAFAIARAGWIEQSAWVLAPVVGALVGTIYELRRTYRTNLKYGEEIRAALQEIAEHEAEARHELMALHEREKQFVRLMEEQVAERTATMGTMLERLRAMGEARASNLRGFSHDLRNPLSVIRANLDFIASQAPPSDDVKEATEDCEHAVRMMSKLLADLVDTAQHEVALVRVTPEQMAVPPLVERLRRRMRALIFGRDIRVSVFHTREAPSEIVTDPVVFERIIDNLLTNAAKYTERGSIVIEIDGSPGFLTVKISDTGRGIAPERLERIFEPGGSDVAARAPHSLGVGLSVVVKLMAQTGGRLEVMSTPASGTTFWAHFPVAPPLPAPARDSFTRETEVTRSVAEVVRIRRSLGKSS
jgi:signal transduction histidine kinase